MAEAACTATVDERMKKRPRAPRRRRSFVALSYMAYPQIDETRSHACESNERSQASHRIIRPKTRPTDNGIRAARAGIRKRSAAGFGHPGVGKGGGPASYTPAPESLTTVASF